MGIVNSVLQITSNPKENKNKIMQYTSPSGFVPQL